MTVLLYSRLIKKISYIIVKSVNSVMQLWKDKMLHWSMWKGDSYLTHEVIYWLQLVLVRSQLKECVW